MLAKDAIKQSLDTADMILGKYVSDLDDAAFLVRPVPGLNHVTWQLGHLIGSTQGMLEGARPGTLPPLPEGFEAKFRKDTIGIDDPAFFPKKDELLALYAAQRKAILASLETLTDADLDAPGPESMRSMAPTVGALINLTGLHVLMHLGQFVAVRRACNLPVVF
jgi:hypothetical protein